MSSLNFETIKDCIETFLNSNNIKSEDDLTKFKDDLTKIIDDIIIKVNTDITNKQNIKEEEELAKIQEEEEDKEKEKQLKELKDLKDQIIGKYHGNTGLIYKKEVGRNQSSLHP